MSVEAAAADGLGWLRPSREGERLVLQAGGAWVIAAAVGLDRQLRAVERSGAREVVVDLAAVTALDTAGAWLLLRSRRDLAAAGLSVELQHLGEAFAPLLRQVSESDEAPPL